jgi:hypothetical protein
MQKRPPWSTSSMLLAESKRGIACLPTGAGGDTGGSWFGGVGMLLATIVLLF